MSEAVTSTFNPLEHGRPEVLQIELWRGEGVRITRDGVVVCQGRSINDVLRSFELFMGLHVIVASISAVTTGRV